MDVAALLLELYDRIPPLVAEAVGGLDTEQLAWTPPPSSPAPSPGSSAGHANPIGWLGWHIARVQDHQIAELVPTTQLWVEGDWAGRFELPPDPENTGYGHGPDDVAAVRPQTADAIVEHLDAVAARTRRYLASVTEAELDRVVDERWDPPVTLGVRLVSIADDCLQHAGQAAYLRGLLTA